MKPTRKFRFTRSIRAAEHFTPPCRTRVLVSLGRKLHLAAILRPYRGPPPVAEEFPGSCSRVRETME